MYATINRKPAAPAKPALIWHARREVVERLREGRSVLATIDGTLIDESEAAALEAKLWARRVARRGCDPLILARDSRKFRTRAAYVARYEAARDRRKNAERQFSARTVARNGLQPAPVIDATTASGARVRLSFYASRSARHRAGAPAGGNGRGRTDCGRHVLAPWRTA